MVKNQAKSITKNSVTRLIIRIIAKFLVATFFATYFLNGDSPNGLPFLSNMSICQRSFNASFKCRICTIFSPSSVSGTTIVMLVFFSSLSFASHSHLIRITHVTVGFLSLFYLFLFGLSLYKFACLFYATLSFFIQACVFFIYHVSFLPKTSFKKDTTPVFLSYLCRYCCFVIVLIVLFSGSSRNMVP